MEGNDLVERNRRFAIGHFDDFVNKKDPGAIDRNMAADFIDHDGPGGKPTDRAGDRAMMEAMYRIFPDLHVEVKQSLAEGDKVMVRNLSVGTDSGSGETHGVSRLRTLAHYGRQDRRTVGHRHPASRARRANARVVRPR